MSQKQIIYDTSLEKNPFIEEYKQTIRYRYLFKYLVYSSVLARYKRSVLGVLWTLLDPLLMMTVLTFAFSALFKYDLPNYPVYILAGTLFWQFFSASTANGMNALVWGGPILKQVYVPQPVFVIAAVGHGLVNFIIGLVPLFLVMMIFKQAFSIALLFLPIAIFLSSVFVTGVTLLLATMAVFFTDIISLYNAILQALFFLTPIMYPIDILPEKIKFLVFLNPLVSFLELFRTPIYYGELPQLKFILLSIFYAISSLALGWWFITRKSKEIPYRI